MKISPRALGKLARVPMSAAFVSLALPTINCFAGETINFDNGASMDYTLTANYGIGVRAEKQSRRILDQLNADDSDRNFDQGSLTTNRLSLLIESDLHKDNYGLFLRGSTFYDGTVAVPSCLMLTLMGPGTWGAKVNSVRSWANIWLLGVKTCFSRVFRADRTAQMPQRVTSRGLKPRIFC
jgi:hypothetical protein